ncbi:hypothetical protein HN695_03325 [Candidatus Woesearchaeota archaeon]|jgi:hypothetical protein|nr:hypothetical protein [Candidatus Woesearchaeota archaeon]MBT5272016.1 hypothetical protein [Candidatus Woesearchaeota archaeon]MBT6040757.1 hypothetical protein [Candidatus Woesearchaeota archaeon]MBT6336709.1 hypothetical protein [Candidatus Woesearchaeota archaeon]MBT7927342.1 hypothetical protein [Candidatus Woesearchaeota archaeon]
MKNNLKLGDKKSFSLVFFVFLIFLVFVLSFSNLDFSKLITGYAISAGELAEIETQTAMLYPVEASTEVGKEISYDVVIYPYLDGVTGNMQKMNNFFVAVKFPQQNLEHKFTESLLENFELNVVNGPGAVKITGYGMNPFEDVFVFEPLAIARVTFVAKIKADTEPLIVEIVAPSIENSFNDDRTEAEVFSILETSELTILEAGLGNFIAENYPGKTWMDLTDAEKNQVKADWDKLTPEEKSQYAVCTPSCQGKQCGTDGCGGFCGAFNGQCADGELCLDGACGCKPNCAGKACGDDGCGGLCSDIECDDAVSITPSDFNLNWLLYAAILFILAGLIGFGYIGYKKFKKKKEFGTTVQQKPILGPEKQETQQSIASPQLVAYVKRNLAKGANEDQIRNALLQVGWDKDKVNAAISEGMK